MDIWVVSTFWLLSVVLWTSVSKFLFAYLFSVLMDKYLGEELWGYLVILSFTFWRNAELFSRAAITFYVTTNNVWEFHFLHIHILGDACYFLSFLKAILVGVKENLTVVLICISLWIMVLNIFFTCLLAIYISSLENSLGQKAWIDYFPKKIYKWPANTFLCCVLFLLLNCKGSLYILDTRPLSDIRFANIFLPFHLSFLSI